MSPTPFSVRPRPIATLVSLPPTRVTPLPYLVEGLINLGHLGPSLESRTYSLESITQATTIGTSVSGLVNRP